MDWNLMSEVPTAPVQVELFYGNLTLTDNETGKQVSAVIYPYRDERRALGYWDGKAWRHLGTGHEVFEFDCEIVEWKPTHWRALPAPPTI